MKWHLLTLLLVMLPATAGLDDDADDVWLEDDSEARALAVNEGELTFLTDIPDTVHHHHNRITIAPSSLEDGWVALEQCHTHLDPVGRAQIVYNRDTVRHLAITAQQGMARAWIEGPTIQLEDIGKESRLCIRAQSRALHRLENGRYELRNGPFMRRFLDGYYPMRVTMQVFYPIGRLRLIQTEPQPQPGLTLEQASGNVLLNARFEGRLMTVLVFEAVSQ